jgi:hypothetical protein
VTSLAEEGEAEQVDHDVRASGLRQVGDAILTVSGGRALNLSDDFSRHERF